MKNRLLELTNIINDNELKIIESEEVINFLKIANEQVPLFSDLKEIESEINSSSNFIEVVKKDIKNISDEIEKERAESHDLYEISPGDETYNNNLSMYARIIDGIKSDYLSEKMIAKTAVRFLFNFIITGETPKDFILRYLKSNPKLHDQNIFSENMPAIKGHMSASLKFINVTSDLDIISPENNFQESSYLVLLNYYDKTKKNPIEFMYKVNTYSGCRKDTLIKSVMPIIKDYIPENFKLPFVATTYQQDLFMPVPTNIEIDYGTKGFNESINNSMKVILNNLSFVKMKSEEVSLDGFVDIDPNSVVTIKDFISGAKNLFSLYYKSQIKSSFIASYMVNFSPLTSFVPEDLEDFSQSEREPDVVEIAKRIEIMLKNIVSEKNSENTEINMQAVRKASDHIKKSYLEMEKTIHDIQKLDAQPINNFFFLDEQLQKLLFIEKYKPKEISRFFCDLYLQIKNAISTTNKDDANLLKSETKGNKITHPILFPPSYYVDGINIPNISEILKNIFQEMILNTIQSHYDSITENILVSITERLKKDFLEIGFDNFSGNPTYNFSAKILNVNNFLNYIINNHKSLDLSFIPNIFIKTENGYEKCINIIEEKSDRTISLSISGNLLKQIKDNIIKIIGDKGSFDTKEVSDFIFENFYEKIKNTIISNVAKEMFFNLNTKPMETILDQWEHINSIMNKGPDNSKKDISELGPEQDALNELEKNILSLMEQVSHDYYKSTNFRSDAGNPNTKEKLFGPLFNNWKALETISSQRAKLINDPAFENSASNISIDALGANLAKKSLDEKNVIIKNYVKNQINTSLSLCKDRYSDVVNNNAEIERKNLNPQTLESNNYSGIFYGFLPDIENGQSIILSEQLKQNIMSKLLRAKKLGKNFAGNTLLISHANPKIEFIIAEDFILPFDPTSVGSPEKMLSLSNAKVRIKMSSLGYGTASRPETLFVDLSENASLKIYIEDLRDISKTFQNISWLNIIDATLKIKEMIDNGEIKYFEFQNKMTKLKDNYNDETKQYFLPIFEKVMNKKIEEPLLSLFFEILISTAYSLMSNLNFFKKNLFSKTYLDIASAEETINSIEMKIIEREFFPLVSAFGGFGFKNIDNGIKASFNNIPLINKKELITNITNNINICLKSFTNSEELRSIQLLCKTITNNKMAPGIEAIINASKVSSPKSLYSLVRNLKSNTPDLPQTDIIKACQHVSPNENLNKFVSKVFKAANFIHNDGANLSDDQLRKIISSENFDDNTSLSGKFISCLAEYYNLGGEKLKEDKKEFLLSMYDKDFLPPTFFKDLEIFEKYIKSRNSVSANIGKAPNYEILLSVLNRMKIKDLTEFLSQSKEKINSSEPPQIKEILMSSNVFNDQNIYEKIMLYFEEEKRRGENMHRAIHSLSYGLSFINDYYTIKKYISSAKPKHTSFLKMNKKIENYSFETLPYADPLHFKVGNLSNCCQRIGGAGEAAAIDSFINPLAGVLIFKKVEDKNNELIAQSYFHVIPELSTIILDNVEANPTRFRALKISINKLYHLWALEMQKAGFKNVLCGKEYNKLNNYLFKNIRWNEEDPRHFEHDDAYSDFDPNDCIDLLSYNEEQDNLKNDFDDTFEEDDGEPFQEEDGEEDNEDDEEDDF